jgi:Sec-independent protein translocase protein TatA
MTRIRFDGYALGSAVSAPAAGTPRFRVSIQRSAVVEAAHDAKWRHRRGNAVYPVAVITLPLGALDNPLNLAVLLVLAVLLFGKQLPDVMRTFGKGVRELRQAANFEDMSDAIKAVNDVRAVATPAAIVRAAVPGAAEIQDSLVETKGVVDIPLDDSIPVIPLEEEVEELRPASVPMGFPVDEMGKEIQLGTAPVPPPSAPWVERTRFPAIMPESGIPPDTDDVVADDE